MFESQGVEIAPLLHAAELDPALQEDRHARLDLEQVNRLWRLAVAASGQETLGLERDLAGCCIDLELAAGWVGSVAQELVRRLRKGEPQAGAFAASIGLTEAVLARQLRAERTSLDDLLGQVRRELAHEYLAGSDAPLAGIPGWLELPLLCRAGSLAQPLAAS